MFLYRHKALFGAAGRTRLRNSFVMMLFNFLMGLGVNTIGDLGGNINVRIANEAHLGGLLGGVILTWLMGPRFLVERLTNPQTGQVGIRVTETNPLKSKARDILLFCCGLIAVIWFALLLRS